MENCTLKHFPGRFVKIKSDRCFSTRPTDSSRTGFFSRRKVQNAPAVSRRFRNTLCVAYCVHRYNVPGAREFNFTEWTRKRARRSQYFYGQLMRANKSADDSARRARAKRRVSGGRNGVSVRGAKVRVFIKNQNDIITPQRHDYTRADNNNNKTVLIIIIIITVALRTSDRCVPLVLITVGRRHLVPLQLVVARLDAVVVGQEHRLFRFLRRPLSRQHRCDKKMKNVTRSMLRKFRRNRKRFRLVNNKTIFSL